MLQRLLSQIRTFLLSLLYLFAIVVSAALVFQTLQLAQRRPEFQSLLKTGPISNPSSGTPTIPQISAAALTSMATPTPAIVFTKTNALSASAQKVANYHPKTGRYVSAWLPTSFSGGARDSLELNKDILDEVSPFWYSTDGSGKLYGTRDDELVKFAHENNVLVIPSVHNVDNYDGVVAILSDAQRRSGHIRNIVDEVLARNYDGIDIDYESLSTSMREAYSIFITDLGQALHAQGKVLTVAVHAKDRDYGGLGGYQDWKVIGQHADRVRIMTYDYHWRGGGPGPIAPLYWVQAVAEYARSVMDSSKIVIGIPFYGYDWPPQGNARGVPWGDIEDLINEENLTVNLMQRNNKGRVDESWLRYSSNEGNREVWFMTAAGLESKLDLVQTMDLAGIAIWRIGYEKPEYWDVVRQKLVQDPVLIQRSINPLLPEH